MKIRLAARISLMLFLVAIVATNATASSSDKTYPGDDIQAFGINATYGKWPDGVVPFVYNPTGAPTGYTDDNTVLARIRAALDEWEGVCGITFQAAGTGIDATADILVTDDNLVVFAWDAGIGGSAGLAGPRSTSATDTADGHWTYDDGTLRLNPIIFNTAGGFFPRLDNNLRAFNSTMLHEVGHLIGLGHSDDPNSIMFANPYNDLDHLRKDDYTACRSMYGYSDKFEAPEEYVAPGAGADPFNSLIFTSSANPGVPLTEITAATSGFPRIEWNVDGAFDQEVTAVAVDPANYKSRTNASSIFCPATFICNGNFSVSSFDFFREVQGNWTIYVIMGGQVIATFNANSTAPLPAWNKPPDATISYTENPATRQVSATVDVTGDTENDLVSIIWHIPSVGTLAPIDLGASSGNNTQNVTLVAGQNHEIFAEVIDDAARYAEDLGNNIGGAGAGFQRLFRYASSKRNLGPDFGGDNSSDIMWRKVDTGTNWLYTMNGATISKSQQMAFVDPSWTVAGTGDYNADGKTDVLWWNFATGTRWMHIMDSTAVDNSLFVNTVTDPFWFNVGSADYDGDGDADLLWRHFLTGRIWMHQLDGAAITTDVGFITGTVGSSVNIIPTAWSITGNGDYDGDGRADIYLRNTGNGINWMYTMNGPAILTSNYVTRVTDLNWVLYGNADFDGDGKADVLWHDPTTGVLWVHLMNGAVISTSSFVNSIGLQWGVASTGDYNGDGKSDILLRDSVSGRNWLYLMDGATILKSLDVNTVAEPASWNVVFTN